MLSSEKRIRKSKEIERILKQGKAFKQDFLVLKVLENHLKINRFAFVVSQKISKKANIRNKLKRRLREIVKSKTEKMESGFDILFIALSGLEKMEFQALEKTVEKLFKKAKIF